MYQTDSNASEHILLNKLSDGDIAAYEQLFDQYWPVLYRKIYSRVLDSDLTKDILQDLFIAVWDKRRQLKVKSLDAYMYGMARNQVNNYFRRQGDKIPVSLDDELHLELSGIAYTDELIASRETEACIRETIGKMPETMRKCIELFRDKGPAIREMAAELNISEQTVKNNLHAARQRLKEAILNMDTFAGFILFLFF
ncbi:RNA polymerase sigma factor [Pedobacter sp. AW31-3R]|uniref:RNA polymerase sigma factor n=1 Tax=Pedobacter sp. AW31-3R TaxID=3445781 RepID=UPI003FA1655A